MVRPHRTASLSAFAVLVLAAGVAYGAKLWQKAPADFYLPPAIDTDALVEPDGFVLSAPAPRVDSPAGTSGSVAPLADGVLPSKRIEVSAHATPAASEPPVEMPGRARPQSNAVTRWIPWGSRGYRAGENWSTSSSGSAALGGLWHAMSPFGGHSAGAADTPVTKTAHAETSAVSIAPSPKPSPAPSPKPAPAPKPSPAPAPAPAPSAGSGSVTAPDSGAAPAPAPSSPAAPSVPSAPAPPAPDAPGSSLGEDGTPLPDLGPGPSPGSGGSGGPIGGGGSTGGGAPSGADMSATPEPGTIALVGTGLLGLLGVFRRRDRH